MLLDADAEEASAVRLEVHNELNEVRNSLAIGKGDETGLDGLVEDAPECSDLLGSEVSAGLGRLRDGSEGYGSCGHGVG